MPKKITDLEGRLAAAIKRSDDVKVQPKLEWSSSYGNHTMRLPSSALISCSWPLTRDEEGYLVQFDNIRLKDRIKDQDKAKAAGMALAIRTMARDMAALKAYLKSGAA